MHKNHFRLSDSMTEEEKQAVLKKKKKAAVLQYAFAALLFVMALAMVADSFLFVSYKQGWGGEKLEKLTEEVYGVEPVAETEESPAESPALPEETVLPESTPAPIPEEAVEITQVVPKVTNISGMKATKVDDPANFVPDAQYCTIWPVKDLTVYSDASRSLETGKVTALGMYCVLEESSGMFRVRTGSGQSGWIDSRYCMINLAEYFGDLCSYNITNSYSSMYTIHEYELPGLTGKQITGYENIKLADGSFLVPFLYPCCSKLLNAAKQAYAAGYRIKIYDSYRPRVATNNIYYTALGTIDSPLPDATCTGNTVALPQMNARGYRIYRDLIEMNGWDMGSFLAPGASRHNMGVALDMTFEDATTKEELSAQTVMHDLSAYSTVRTNNALAAEMYKLMEGCKMHNIISEWWHFQDNEAMNSLQPPYCENGVSAEGWVADANGERFRLADGTVLKSCVMVTDDSTLYFDAEGYLIKQEPNT